MASILITYSTTDGHTRSICERLKLVIEEQSHSVVISAMADHPDIDIEPYDKIVIGASIRYGKHQKQVFEFIQRNQSILDGKPNAFFSVNVFAGKIDYPRYTFVDKHMIRFILWMGNGPTDLSSVTEFTDWEKVAEFGRSIADI